MTDDDALDPTAAVGSFFVVDHFAEGAGWRPLRELVEQPDVLRERVAAARPMLAERSRVVASSLAGALTMLRHARPGRAEEATGMVSTLLHRGTLAGAGDLDVVTASFVRHSCCLLYRVPAAGSAATACRRVCRHARDTMTV